MKNSDKLPYPTRPYLKIVTVSVRDISYMEEHHCSIENIGMVKAYVYDNRDKYEICNVYVMNPDILSIEDKTRLEMNGIKY